MNFQFHGVLLSMTAALIVCLLPGCRESPQQAAGSKGEGTNPKGEEPGEGTGLQVFLPGKMVDLLFEEEGVFKGKVRLVFREDGTLSVDQEERVSVGEDGAVTVYDDNPLRNGTYRVGGALVILKFARHEVLGVLEFSGGLPEEGGEARLDVGGEEVLKGKIVRVFSSYGEVPRTLADFKGLLDKPLNDREKQLVGRWEHVNEEAQLRSWHINREDHTASSFTISPKYDDEGEVVPGEQVRTMNHHIWCVADEVVYFVPLVVDQTVNPITDDSQVLRAPNEIGTLYLVSVDGEKRTFRWKLPDEYGGDAIEPFHDRRIEAFDETEMKPFNEPGALQGFDILKAYEEARGREETPGPAPAPELEGEGEDPPEE